MEQEARILSFQSDRDVINEHIAQNFRKENADLQDRRGVVLEALCERTQKLQREERELHVKIETIRLAHKNLRHEQPDLYELELVIQREEEKIFREKQLIQNYENEAKKIQREDAEKRLELQQEATEATQLQLQIAALEQQVGSQALDRNEAQRVEIQIQQTEQQLARLRETKRQRLEQTSALNQQIEQVVVAFEQDVQQYNALLAQNVKHYAQLTDIQIRPNFDVVRKQQHDELVEACYKRSDAATLQRAVVDPEQLQNALQFLHADTSAVRNQISIAKLQIQELEREAQLAEQRIRELEAERKAVLLATEQQLEILRLKQSSKNKHVDQLNAEIEALQLETNDAKVQIEKFRLQAQELSQQLHQDMNNLEQVNKSHDLRAQELDNRVLEAIGYALKMKSLVNENLREKYLQIQQVNQVLHEQLQAMHQRPQN